MAQKFYPNTRIEVEPNVRIGPRLAVEIRRRIRELDQRVPSAMTSADRSELSKLRSMLVMIATVEEAGQ